MPLARDSLAGQLLETATFKRLEHQEALLKTMPPEWKVSALQTAAAVASCVPHLSSDIFIKCWRRATSVIAGSILKNAKRADVFWS